MCLALLAPGATAVAEPGPGIQLEQLDRGLVAVTTDEGVFLSWRLLASEVGGHTDSGLQGPVFRVYRDGKVVGVVRDSTNYLDEQGSAGPEYRVVPVPRRRPGTRSRRCSARPGLSHRHNAAASRRINISCLALCLA